MRGGIIGFARICTQLAAVVALTLVTIQDQQVVSAQRVVADEPGVKVRIGVLGLFHPREFRISATAGHALVLRAGTRTVVLENSSGLDLANIQRSDADVLVLSGQNIIRAPAVAVSGRNGEPVDFLLAIPGKITRRYHCTLEIKSDSASLVAIATMDMETAVASIVAAESAPDTPVEALKAQSIATRSYLFAGRGRHRKFDFCDTTHCQLLREPPLRGSIVSQAVADTRGLVLSYRSRAFAAMYTRSCSGRTRTAQQLGLSPAEYPYYPVECAFCRSHPSRWTTRISAKDAAELRSSDESSRLNLVRRLGWNVVPSNDFVSVRNGDEVVLQGTGRGHGIGLCQSGSSAMAKAGASFREILDHYYPNTTLIVLAGHS
jgi:stage II sporulation protein D